MTEESAIITYFNKLSEKPLLTREEEQELFRKMADGDSKAREELITRNIRLVIPTVKQYSRRAGVSFADIVQEGTVAVIHAVDKFDWKLGNKFSTYATYWINQRVGRYVKKHSRNVFVPEHIVNLAIQINKCRRAMAQETGEDENTPLDETPEGFMDTIRARLYDMFGVDATPKEIRTAMESCQTETSMSAPVGDEDKSEFGDFIKDEGMADPAKSTDDEYVGQRLTEALKNLSDLEKCVVQFRYGIGSDLLGNDFDCLSSLFGTTKERLIEAAAEGEKLMKAELPRLVA